MPHASANNAELYFEEQGTGDPLLLIMGLGATHVGWMFQVLAFRKHHRVITYDSRGLGLSRDDGEPYTLRTLADDAVALLDHLKIERSHVLGLSLGGMVAQEVAINYPARVRKLVLAATSTGGARSDISPELRRAFRIEPGTDLQTISENGVQVEMDEAGEAIVRLSFNNPLVPWALTKAARRSGGPPLPEGTGRQSHAAAQADTLERLRLISAPTLVIAGTKDRVIPPHASEILAGRIPNATLKLVDGASHGFFLEAPWRFNRPVLRFLSER